MLNDQGQVVQPSRSSQSDQPIPNPSGDRSGQPVFRTDGSGQPVVGADARTVQDVANQPTLNPIRERTERPVISDDLITVQDERKTSRSQEIDVNSVHEETVSSDNPLLKDTQIMCQMVAKYVLVMKE